MSITLAKIANVNYHAHVPNRILDMKTCRRCVVSKPKSEFSKQSAQADKLNPYCKECLKKMKQVEYANNKEFILARSKEWRSKNPDKLKAINSAWARNNKAKVRADAKVWRDKNKDKVSANSRRTYVKHKSKIAAAHSSWKKQNLNLTASYAANRRASKLQRTPAWLSDEHREQMKQMYINAKLLSEFLGEKYTVDHIVPLCGRTVSGLHVPWNLQLMIDVENYSKRNDHWPDMP